MANIEPKVIFYLQKISFENKMSY